MGDDRLKWAVSRGGGDLVVWVLSAGGGVLDRCSG